ncbi:MAG: outer membrane beta-barrel protein [Pacificibacter sp.]|uniref:outer membrane protein n=1 Tax=Pacificibacter sp. TaxID=1917866 RepID=UPI0032190F27
MPKLLPAPFLAAALAFSPILAQADTEVSFYGGYQTAPHSVVSGNDPEATWSGEFTAAWEGKSTAMPPYYGLRATRWRSDNWGWGGEFTHAKVYADDTTLIDNGYDRFEFTDGLNIITVNAMRRWPGKWGDKFTPYVGAGIGFAMPHVDIQAAEGAHTFGYQVTGPAVRALAGVRYEVNDRWATFTEYQGTYSMNKVDLENGGSIETNVITNALNVGISYSF